MQAATKAIVNLENIKGAIAEKIDVAGFTSWISPLDFEISENTLVMRAHNQFTADYVRSVYSGVLAGVAESFGLGIDICAHRTNAPKTTVANDNNVQVFTPEITNTFDATVSFDRFVATDENAFVLSACKKVATGAVSFSPLFMYGPAGCGKTLLAECIRATGGSRVLMMSGAQFVSEFTRSLQSHSVFAFKDFCRNCDTFILDDVQTLSGKRASCEEFMQLILDLRADGKNIVLVANSAPGNLTGFDRRAQSLMASGLVADVVAPNAAVKCELLRRAGLASDIADMVVTRVKGDGHMISGIVNKIKTYTELMGVAVNADVASRLLGDSLGASAVKNPVVMVRNMSEKLGVSYDAVCGSGRSRSLVLARQIMMTVLKKATNMSLAEIGNAVGGRDHATVVYAINQIEKMQKADLVLSAQIEQLVAECK